MIHNDLCLASTERAQLQQDLHAGQILLYWTALRNISSMTDIDVQTIVCANLKIATTVDSCCLNCRSTLATHFSLAHTWCCLVFIQENRDELGQGILSILAAHHILEAEASQALTPRLL